MSYPQSTAYTVLMKLFLAGTNTPATGKTAAVTLSKAGAAFGNPSAGASNATEVANGVYSYALSVTDTGTIGDLWIQFTATGCDVGDRCLPIVNANNGGLVALPNAASGSAGGVLVQGTGTTGVAVTAGKINGVSLVDTLTTYTGNTPQTGDSFGLIGTAGVGLTNLGDTRIAHLNADVSSRMATYTQPTGFLSATFPTGTIANTTNITSASGITVSTNSDKTGYSLTQSFPANFSSLAIDSSGRTNAFLIGILTSVFTEGVTGQIAAAFKQFFNIASPTSTMNTITTVTTTTTATTATNLTNLPAVPTDWLTAAGVKADAVTKIQSGLSTYAGADTAGTTTLLTRLTAAILFDGNGFVKSDVEDWKAATAPAMTGDSFALIGTAGVGLTNLGDTRIAHLNADITSRMATYTQPTGFLAATFPSGTIANTTNVTAGTITTVSGNVSGNVVGSVGSVVSPVQVSNIGESSSALNGIAAAFTQTTGSVTSGTYANTATLDGVSHVTADSAGTLDEYYDFSIGTTGQIGTSFQFEGYLVGIANTLKVFAYNWGATAWDQIGNIAGVTTVTDQLFEFDVVNSHTSGTGVVRIRFQSTGLTTAALNADRLLLGYTVVQSFPSNFASLGITAAGKISEVVLVDTLTTYTSNTPQGGDSFTLIGTAGVGLTNLGDTRIAHLNADVSSRMATYTQPAGFLAATFPTTVASPTNITTASGISLAASQHVIVDSGTITTLTNLPAITTDWITSAGVSAAAVTKIQSGLSTYAGGAVASVAGNVGGNVVGSVGSISGVTFPTHFSSIAISVSGIVSADAATFDGGTSWVHTGGKPWVLDGSGNAVAPASATTAIASVLPAAEFNKAGGLASMVAFDGTAASGGTNTVVLSAALGADNLVANNLFNIIAGHGTGISMPIATYVDSTQTLSFLQAFPITPNNTSQFVITYDDTPGTDGSGSVRIQNGVLTGQIITSGGLANVNVTEVNGTNQTAGDICGKLGTPAGASIAADIAEIEAETDGIATVQTGVTSLLVDVGLIPTAPLLASSYTAPNNAGIATIIADMNSLTSTGSNSLATVQSHGDGTWSTATGFATPTNITAGTITTVTGVTGLTTSTIAAAVWAYILTGSTSAGVMLLSVGGWISTAAVNIRNAVGMGSANLDTQLAAVPTAVQNRQEMDSNSTQLGTIITDLGTIETHAASADTNATAGAASAATAVTQTTAAAIGNAVLDQANAIESGITLRGATKVVFASQAGKTNGAATPPFNIRDYHDTKNVISAVDDSDGNRTSTTVDVS
jgi:hypothetical protein